MAKLIKIEVDKEPGKEKWGGTFFTATDTTEAKADNQIKNLVKKYVTDKGKSHKRTVEDV